MQAFKYIGTVKGLKAHLARLLKVYGDVPLVSVLVPAAPLEDEI